MGTEKVTLDATLLGPRVEGNVIRFTFPDEDQELQAVRLYQEVQRPRNGPDFSYETDSGLWTLEFPSPPASRMEYLLQLVHLGGDHETITDPFNNETSPGAFGNKSVVLLPGYETPAWLAADAPAGELAEIEVPCRAVKGALTGLLWSPPGSGPRHELPLLVVHDGPEYAALSSLTRFFEVMLDDQRVPPFRAALIAPKERNEIYSASAAYARSLAHEMVPALADVAPTPAGRAYRIGMGASLGALAMLHAHRRTPALFGALYLQSGSYFRTRFDKHETGFPRFRRISRFAGQVLTARGSAHPIRVTLTCGSIEENLANNRAMAEALETQGYPVELVVNPDGHNWVGWRDTFDPHLADLLREQWG